MRFLSDPPAYDLTYSDVFMVPNRSAAAAWGGANLGRPRASRIAR